MPEPFFATLFTLSSHHPFVVPEQYADTLPDGYDPDSQGRSLRRSARSAASTAVSAARSGSAARSSYSSPTMFRRRNSPKKRAPTRRTCHIVGFIHTPDGALHGAGAARPRSKSTSCPPLLGLMGNTGTLLRLRTRRAERADSGPAGSVSYDAEIPRADGRRACSCSTSRAPTGAGRARNDDLGPEPTALMKVGSRP